MSISCTRKVYLDNAATTQLDPEVLEVMLPYMQGLYGNPSSTHVMGNKAKVAVEDARVKVMDSLGAGEGSVFFTSSGTEANNWAIVGAVQGHDLQHVITSRIEHESVLKCIERLIATERIGCSYVHLDKEGSLNYASLEALLAKYPRSLVSLMHGNNEVGNLTDLYTVGRLCKKYNAIFHTDMVQTLGYYKVCLKDMPIDICTGSGHKFHGPKGVGFIYIDGNVDLGSILYGGMQERGLRAGTENVPSIIGLSKALEIAVSNRLQHFNYLQGLKKYMIEGLEKAIPSITFHGLSKRITQSLCNLLSTNLPVQGVNSEIIILQLSNAGIYASKGSACMSGSSDHSHVLKALKIPEHHTAVRFSFSKYTSYEDVDYTVRKLSTIINK